MDDDSELIFSSPAPAPASSGAKSTEPNKPKYSESRFTTEENREAALKQELENVRKINQVIEGVVDSLEKAKSNMDVCFSAPLSGLSFPKSLHQHVSEIVSWTKPCYYRPYQRL